MKKRKVEKSTEEEKRIRDRIPPEIKMIFRCFSDIVSKGVLGKRDFKLFLNKFCHIYLEKKGINIREDQVEEFMCIYTREIKKVEHKLFSFTQTLIS